MPAAAPLLALMALGCVPELTSPHDDSGAGTWTAPSNTWPVSIPPADLVGEGHAEGQIIPDFLRMDQHGDMVSLWQFYGSVVVIDISTMWCGPCAALADGVTETWHDYQDQGFMYLTLLPEDDVTAAVPDQEDLVRWATDHGILAPVLQDGIGRSYEMVPEATYPRIFVIDRQMKVAVDKVNPAEDAAIRAAVEALL